MQLSKRPLSATQVNLMVDSVIFIATLVIKDQFGAKPGARPWY
jgi:hypothetical protein